MKATLEFQLPEERAEFNNACNGTDYASIIRLVQERLRVINKYEDADTDERGLEAFMGRQEAVQEIRVLIADLLDEHALEV